MNRGLVDSISGMREVDDSFGKALKYAQKILDYRDRSMREMQQKLTGKGFSKKVVDETLAYLEEKSLIDDLRLAELLKKDAVERRHFGARGVRSYLIRRGIAKDVADAMAEADSDYIDAAMQLAEKKMRSMGHLDSVTIKRRLWGLLARRGFTSDEMHQVLERLNVEL
ncbi:MAG TPA: regulatory protein RecX [Dissulfurispiraceae bacterium]|nr:regulatory protein RecX [Dissulfurispiraceae bacterium]